MRISDWSSDVCSSDLRRVWGQPGGHSEPRPKGSVLALSPEMPWACAARPVCLGVAVGAWSRSLKSGLGSVDVIARRPGTRRLRRGSASSGLRGRCRCEPFRGDAPFEFDSKPPTQERLACGRGAMLVVCRRRSEEHTSELQSLMRNSYAGSCLTK